MYGFIGDHRRRALLLPEVRQRAHFQAVCNPVCSMCVAAANLSSSSCNLDSGDAGYIYIYAFFIHASLPCYIQYYLSCMLQNVLLLMCALSLIISVEGGIGSWSFFWKKYYFFRESVVYLSISVSFLSECPLFEEKGSSSLVAVLKLDWNLFKAW